MRHLRLKFNHGVEIGARLAYEGHYSRTGDEKLLSIAGEEREHQEILSKILGYHGARPSKVIDGFFTLVGRFVAWACMIAPLWSLDLVARSLEVFAVFSYRSLAKAYPGYAPAFRSMAEVEDKHRRYFAGEAA